MPFLKTACPQCLKGSAESEKEFIIGDAKILKLVCGHFIREVYLKNERTPESIVSLDGKRLYPFQREGVNFALKGNARVLIADEMGLGKTIQALGTLAMNDSLFPVLIIPKSSLKVQWQHESMRWLGEDVFVQIIEDSKTFFIPGCKGYIISYDLIRRFNGNLVERIKELGIKTIILDEVQQIKNPASQRTVEVRNLCKVVDHIIALSGTPIKNNAAEYFSILNILHPEIFSNYSRFQYNWCESIWDGYRYKVGGLRNPKEFQERTKHFIIRRERAEVMPDLPRITRNFSFHELGKEVEKTYIESFKEFRDEYNSSGMGSFEDSSHILARIAKLRHIVGISKIDPCIDHVMEFLGSTDRKITIFVHHKDVSEILKNKLTSLMTELELCAPLTLTSELDSDARARIVDEFMNGPSRVLIASTLASGEGLNLQKCSDCIMLERQWNPANEEQAEGRFIRIGQEADAVTATYLVAVGTIDEFFSTLVEQKRQYVLQTLGGEVVIWSESSLMKELVEVLANSGGQRWRI